MGIVRVLRISMGFSIIGFKSLRVLLGVCSGFSHFLVFFSPPKGRGDGLGPAKAEKSLKQEHFALHLHVLIAEVPRLPPPAPMTTFIKSPFPKLSPTAGSTWVFVHNLEVVD